MVSEVTGLPPPLPPLLSEHAESETIDAHIKNIKILFIFVDFKTPALGVHFEKWDSNFIYLELLPPFAMPIAYM